MEDAGEGECEKAEAEKGTARSRTGRKTEEQILDEGCYNIGEAGKGMEDEVKGQIGERGGVENSWEEESREGAGKWKNGRAPKRRVGSDTQNEGMEREGAGRETEEFVWGGGVACS